MATWTYREATNSSANSQSYAALGITPAVGDLLVVTVVTSATVAAGGVTSTGSGATAFDKITSTTHVAGSTMYLFVSTSLVTAADSHVVTFTCTGDAATGAVVTIHSLAGMTKTGAGAVRQFAVQANQAAGGTPAPAFSNTTQATSALIGVIGNSTAPAGMTPPADWTEQAQADTGYTSPNTGSETAYRNSGFAGTTVTWGSTSASGFGAIIAEFDTSPFLINKNDTIRIDDIPASANSTYYFDTSDGGPTDADAVWSNDANGFDGSTSTFATIGNNVGSTSSKFLFGAGTTAPTTGNSISAVRARGYGGATGQVKATVYTDALAESLGEITTGTSSYGNYLTLTDPSGGWSWQGVNDLEVKAYLTAGTSGSFARIEVDVLEPGVVIVAGSTDLSINKSDSITVTESVGIFTDKLYRSVSDSITVTESVGRMLESSVSKSDSVSITENVNLALGANVSVSDNITVTENVKVELTSFVNKSDSITVTESRTVFIPELLRSVSDSVTVTENVKVELTSFINKSDNITITENADPELVSFVNVSDNVTVTESIKLLDELNVNKSDSISISENVGVTITSDTLPDLNVAVSDSVTVTESVQRLLTSVVSVNDTATITENVDLELVSFINKSDSVTVSESVIALIPELLIVKSDSITVTESIGRLLLSFVNKSDSVTITENISVFIPTLNIATSDPITVSESITVNRVEPGVPQISVSDTATITESVNLLIPTLFIQKNETITVTENVSLVIPTLSIATSDSITISESVSVTIPSAGGAGYANLLLLGVG